MKPNSYKVLLHAVEIGVALGVSRAFKHDENPSFDQLTETVEQAVVDQICEWFEFEPDFNSHN
jgi:hypothetical protein